MHGIEGLLVTAIGGYWVLERSETHKGQLKSVGRLLGAGIIAASLVSVACHMWSLSPGGDSCPFTKGRKMGMGEFPRHRLMPPPSGDQGSIPPQ